MKRSLFIILIVLSTLNCYSENGVEQYFQENLGELESVFYTSDEDKQSSEIGVYSVVLGGKYCLFLWTANELMQEEWTSNAVSINQFKEIKKWYDDNKTKLTWNMIHSAQQLFLKDVSLILLLDEWNDQNSEFMTDYVKQREILRKELNTAGVTHNSNNR